MKKRLLTVIFVFVSIQIFSQNCNIICNGGFDSVIVGSTVGLVTNAQMPCWQTTSSDGKFEVWADGYNGIASYSGAQFVEMNATEYCSLYQNVTLSPGSLLSIGFAHRGRGGIDSVSVSVGPVGGPYTVLGVYGDGQSAWQYRTINYTVPSGQGNSFSIRFNSIYAALQNPAIGNFLDAVSVCAQSPSSINKVDNIDFSFFPNPSNGRIIIDGISKNGIITIYNSTGETISVINILQSKTEVDLSFLSKGVYFIKLDSENSFAVKKLILE